jgi:predicted nucleic acid-binding protein
LGFNMPTDPDEEIIRKKKEDEVTKKIQREEVDFHKMMKRKKQDNEIIEALIKDKKQVMFTYDYDGLLLPVSKLENSRMPVTQFGMK